MQRWLRRQAKRQLFALHRLGTRLGVHVLPVHYYSPLPDLIELERTRDVWARKSELPGIAVDLDAQVRNLEAICLPYQAEYAGNPAYRHAVEHAFGPGYGYIEAQALHAVVRRFRPRRVMEVGSGVSTWCLLHALARNREETGLPFALTCVEPHPSRALRALDGIELVEKAVQRVPFAEGFADLGDGDLLFIDSSHAVKPGSDVNYLFLEILPRLRRGVIVHVHDVFLPYDYPRAVLQTFFRWTETSLLRAFLVGNARVEILFCESMLHYDRPDALRRVFPEYRPATDVDGIGRHEPLELASDGHFPSSIYLRMR
jgi:predicted O-methyltransferase YrrM